MFERLPSYMGGSRFRAFGARGSRIPLDLISKPTGLHKQEPILSDGQEG